MDKAAMVNPTDKAINYKALVDRYLADIERVQQSLTEDQREIEELQKETRSILDKLLKAA